MFICAQLLSKSANQSAVLMLFLLSRKILLTNVCRLMKQKNHLTEWNRTQNTETEKKMPKSVFWLFTSEHELLTKSKISYLSYAAQILIAGKSSFLLSACNIPVRLAEGLTFPYSMNPMHTHRRIHYIFVQSKCLFHLFCKFLFSFCAISPM